MIWRGLLLVICGWAAMAATGCGRRESVAPPTIRYGQDICVHCGMIISDERYAAALLVRDERQDIVPLLFDDIGDLLDYEAEVSGLQIERRFVHDLHTKAWIEASGATFARCDTFRTPMASGLAAFADRAQAEGTIAECGGGELLSLDALLDSTP